MTTFTAPDPLTPILTKGWNERRSWTLNFYLSRRDYEGLKRVNTMEAAEIVSAVETSGLRGRSGAGFPTGLKWSFPLPGDGRARYLVVNADESEPGTCKDIPTVMVNPYVLTEDVATTSRTINYHHAFIYLCGEVVHVYRRLPNAIKEAKEAGILLNLEIIAYAGAGTYICGEESALLDSPESRRGYPYAKSSLPVAADLYVRPTVVNNVGSIV